MPPRGERFSGAIRAELEALQAAGVRRRFKAGDVVFYAGEAPDGLYVIDSGRVRIIAPAQGAEQRVLATIEAGDFFGEMSVLDDAPRSATAQALADTTTLFISRDELLSLLEREPRLGLMMLREFSSRIRALNQKYVEDILQTERLALVGRFAATIVHDFKNPLAIIGLAAELGCAIDTPPELRAEAQQKINRQVDRMSNLLHELIEFSRPRGQKPTLHATSFADFVDPVLRELRQELEDRRVKLVADPAPRRVVQLDAARMSRVMYNLLNNAAEAMPNGGKIYISYVEHPGALQVDVEDTGPGIAPEVADALFEPFTTHGKASGTGLGLAICKKIVEDHGGQMWAATAKGGGATFSFTLPLAT